MSADGEVRTRSNRSGGVQGGISNGEDIVLRVAFKPTATIARKVGVGGGIAWGIGVGREQIEVEGALRDLPALPRPANGEGRECAVA
jgi:hypothetical protein